MTAIKWRNGQKFGCWSLVDLWQILRLFYGRTSVRFGFTTDPFGSVSDLNRPYPARVPRMLSFFSSFACERSERQISKLSKRIPRIIPKLYPNSKTQPDW